MKATGIVIERQLMFLKHLRILSSSKWTVLHIVLIFQFVKMDERVRIQQLHRLLVMFTPLRLLSSCHKLALNFRCKKRRVPAAPQKPAVARLLPLWRSSVEQSILTATCTYRFPTICPLKDTHPLNWSWHFLGIDILHLFLVMLRAPQLFWVWVSEAQISVKWHALLPKSADRHLQLFHSLETILLALSWLL